MKREPPKFKIFLTNWTRQSREERFSKPEPGARAPMAQLAHARRLS